jgi:hypothetical protein
MNEQTLVKEFSLAVRDEPPLGFEPDDVVTRAALRYRRRQVTTLVGFGVVAVAAAAIALPLTLGHSTGSPVQISTARPPAAGPASGTAHWPNSTTTRQPKPTDAQLTATGTAIAAHLRSVLPTMSAGAGLGAAPMIGTGQFGALELGNVDSATEPGATVRQSMTTPDGPFSVTIDVDALPATAHSFALGDVCTAARQQIDPTIACTYAQRSDGTLLLTMNLPSTTHSEIWVTSYRPDGLMVSATTSYDGHRTDALPLTEAQVTDLATDPAFTVAK